MSAGIAIIVTLLVALITSLLSSYSCHNTGFLILVAVLIGSIIGVLLHYRYAVRIKAVTAVAVKLAAGDMTVRADEKGSDEISDLAVTFNTMVGGISIWRNNLEEIAASQMKELLVLFDIVNTTSQSLGLGTVLQNVLELVTDTMGAAKGVIVLVGGDGKSLNLMARRGISDESILQITQEGMGGIKEVILRNKTMRIGAISEEGPHVLPGLDKDNIVSAMVAPISARGIMYGALAVYSENKESFTDQDETLLATIGNQVSGAVLNARLYEETLLLAQRDGLTGLVNRRYLMECLQKEIDRANRYQTSLSVIIIDLDKFKSFNDMYGHLKGDDLLRAFSTMVKSTIRTTDIAGRYGGEEFCIVLPNTSIKGVKVIAEGIRKSMEMVKISVGDNQQPAGRTVSIGAAEFSSGESMEHLLSTADAALYRAKEGGRNRVEL